MVALRRLPICVYVKLEESETEFLPPKPCILHSLIGADRACSECTFYPGVLAVKPYNNKVPWPLQITSLTEDGTRGTKVIRTQLPIMCVKSSTLRVLQGTTADLGLIFHWAFPRRFRRDMRWLAVYVALSRVRRLKNFRSVGLNSEVRMIMEAGPPDTLPAQFQKLFAEKEEQTAADAEAAMAALGWAVV